MRTRASDSQPARSPTPVPSAASTRRRTRRDTPAVRPAGARSRGLLLGPLAEGRGRGGLARPVSCIRGTADSGVVGCEREAHAGATAPVANSATSPVPSGPRPASEGPFIPTAPASPAPCAVPKREPQEDLRSAATPPVGGVPPAADLPGRPCTPEARVVPPRRADTPHPDALRGGPASPLGSSERRPDGTEAGEYDTPPPPPYDLPPSSPPGDEGDDDTPGSAAAGTLAATRDSLSPDTTIRDDRMGASPARPSPDEDERRARASADGLRRDRDGAGTVVRAVSAGDAPGAAQLRSPSPVLSYYDPGDEPDLPPRRNAPTEPRVTVFTTDVEALLDEIQRVPPARAGQGAGPIARFVPRPDEGFPVAHVAHPRVTFLNLKDSQRRDWSAHAGPKALVQFGGHGALDDMFNANLGLITNATSELHAFLGSTSACIAIPLPKDVPTGPNQAPLFTLIHDLSEEELARVLAQQVIATPRVTMLVSEYGVPMPVLVGALTGFRSSNADEIYLLVRDRIEELIPFIMTKAYENPEVAAAISLKAFADRVLASVRVKHLPMRGEGGKADPHFYVYASLPLTHFPSFREVQLRLAQADWGHSFAGSGRFHILEDPFCSFCHGADHPRGLCPLLAVPDWVSPVDPPPPRALANHKRRVGEQSGGERRKVARLY